MSSQSHHILTNKNPLQSANRQSNRIVITEDCLFGLQQCLNPEINIQHEGISYLVGATNDYTTLAVAAIRPNAITTPYSFSTDTKSVAEVVRSSVTSGLQVVGQVHTHPGKAYHSEGDETGARIAYSGYISVVLPFYGRFLPTLKQAAVYIFQAKKGFIKIDTSAVTIVSGRLT